jgi:hypothetical protein
LSDSSQSIKGKQKCCCLKTITWEFYIGGYQPAQKWLKDRKGRTLSYEDIQHYQKIIVALAETDRLMKEIDEIEISF